MRLSAVEAIRYNWWCCNILCAEYLLISYSSDVGKRQLCMRIYNIHVIPWVWGKVPAKGLTIARIRSRELCAPSRWQSLKQFTNKPKIKNEKRSMQSCLLTGKNPNYSPKRNLVAGSEFGSNLLDEYPYMHETASTYGFGPSSHNLLMRSCSSFQSTWSWVRFALAISADW